MYLGGTSLRRWIMGMPSRREREIGTISGHRPLEGAAVGAGGVAVLRAVTPASSAPSAGRLACRFGRSWFPNLRRLIGTARPGLLIAVGYIDPGNWAPDLGGGARSGYTPLSMVLIANPIANGAQAACVPAAPPP